MRKIIIATSLFIAVVACKKSEALSGNGGLGGSGGIAAVSPDSGSTRQAALQVKRAVTDTSEADGTPAAAGAPKPDAPLLNRMMVRTATVSMVVGDTLSVLDRIIAAVEANGGYVNDSKVWREGELTRATLSLRVPAAKLTATLAAVRKLAVRVQSENVASEEVTQEYVDLASQLRNDEAAEVELRQLMTDVRQRMKKADDVLQVHEQLRTLRASIEKTKGRMQYLSQMASFSTINLELVPDAIAQPLLEPGWQPVVIAKDAARALVGVMQALAASAIWIAIYVLPLLVVLAIAVFIAWRILVVLKRRLSGITL